MMNWGQLRLQLTTGAAGVDIDLVDEFLNSRYEEILTKNEWQGIRAHAVLTTTAAYLSTTDTATFTVGSNLVQGVGTAWVAGQAGLQMYRPGDAVFYTVQSVTDAGDLALDRPYEGIGANAPGTVLPSSAYVFMQNLYALPANCSEVLSILDPVTSRPLQGMSKEQLDQSAGERTLVQNPKCYAPYDDTPEASPPVLHRVELYPPPQYARGMKVSYIFAALPFDGVSTSLFPLPFVLSAALLAGARASIALGNGDLAAAALYKAEFTSLVDAMMLKDHRTRPQTGFVMAGRFTRHRLARAQRGARTWFTGTEKPGV